MGPYFVPASWGKSAEEYVEWWQEQGPLRYWLGYSKELEIFFLTGRKCSLGAVGLHSWPQGRELSIQVATDWALGALHWKLAFCFHVVSFPPVCMLSLLSFLPHGNRFSHLFFIALSQVLLGKLGVTVVAFSPGVFLDLGTHLSEPVFSPLPDCLWEWRGGRLDLWNDDLDNVRYWRCPSGTAAPEHWALSLSTTISASRRRDFCTSRYKRSFCHVEEDKSS